MTDPDVTVGEMRDPHRCLWMRMIGSTNAGQAKKLWATGYVGPFSFEPFSSAVHQQSDIETALRESMEFLAD